MKNPFINNNCRKSIKNKAFEEPKGTLAKALLCVLVIFTLFYYLFAYIFMSLNYQNLSSLILLLSVICVFPLIINYINLFMLNSKDEMFEFKDLFKNPSRAFKGAFLLLILLTIYLIGKLIFSYIPFIGYFLYLVFTIILMPLFIITPMVFLDNDIDIKDSFIESWKLLKGNRMKFYGFLFSFIPWFILGAITLGLLYFWIVPYVMISFTYLYIEIKKPEFKKEERLSDLGVVLITIIVFVLFLISSFVNIPQSFNNFVNTIFNYQIIENKGEYKLSYNETLIATYDVPKGYKKANQTKYTTTFIGKNNIVLYTVYLSDVDKVISLDKKTAKKLENVNDQEFTLKLKGQTLKGYEYTVSDSEKNIIVYYPKGSITIAVTLSSRDLSIDKKDIKEFIKIY